MGWAQEREALTTAPCTLPEGPLAKLSSPAPAPAGYTKLRNCLVMWKNFVKTSPRELPSLPHKFCSRLQTDLGFPKWIVGSVFDVYIQRIYCGKRAWSASKCNLSVFPSVVCLSIHLRQGNVHDIYCFAFWWRYFLYSLCILQ